MRDYYILKGKTPVPCDVLTWEREFEKDRTVARTETGDITVSTVFLGLDHSFGDGPPLLFETMTFGGQSDEYQARCSTWDEAEAQHAKAVAMAHEGAQ